MRSYGRAILGALSALALAVPCQAGGTDGATPFNFIFLDAGARPVALGGAYVAAANDANALLYNPAGLGALDETQLVLMYNRYFQGVTQEYGAFAQRIGARERPGQRASHGWGAMLNTLSFGKIQRTTLSQPEGAGLGTFGIRDWVVSLGYGGKVTDRLSLGFAAKGFYETIDNASVLAPAGDVGLLYRFEELPISLGLAAQNLGPKVRFNLDREELPLNIRAGLAFRWLGSGLLTLDANQPKNGQVTAHGGVEYVALERLALRLGYSGRNQAGSGLAMGFGIALPGASVDYAFVPFGDLGDSHRLSLLLRWGGEEKSSRPRAARKDATVDPVEDHFARAGGLIEAGNYAEAKKELSAAADLMGEGDRRWFRYYGRRGAVALREGEIKAAERFYHKGLTLGTAQGITDSRMAEVYAGMGACLAAQKNSEYAIKYLSKALEFEPAAETRRMIQEQLRRLEAEGR